MKTRLVKKAVFPVAGFGTRFLPATKAMPKELLPIIDKPLIQYAAEEAIAAGIDTLIFVTGRNKRAIEDHFDSNPELEGALRAKGRHKEAEMIRNILPAGVECIFVRQPQQLGLGHAILCAKKAVGDGPFAVLLADDFLSPIGVGATTNLVNSFHSSGKMQLSSIKVSGPDISKYGVLSFDNQSGSVIGLVEKPDFENAPSDIASIGRYILLDSIFETLETIYADHTGEIQLANAVNVHARKGEVEFVMHQSERFDCGSIQGYLEAINHVAKSK